MNATWTTPKGATIKATRHGDSITATINGTRTMTDMFVTKHWDYGMCLRAGDNYIPVAESAQDAIHAMDEAIAKPAGRDVLQEAIDHRAFIARKMDADEDREPADRTPWQKGG